MKNDDIRVYFKDFLILLFYFFLINNKPHVGIRNLDLFFAFGRIRTFFSQLSPIFLEHWLYQKIRTFGFFPHLQFFSSCISCILPSFFPYFFKF